MHLFKIMLVVATTVLSTEACKCVNAQGAHNVKTKFCCKQQHGLYQGNDCVAGSIAQKLSAFHDCCENFGFASDCNCPSGCKDVSDPALPAGTPFADISQDAIVPEKVKARYEAREE